MIYNTITRSKEEFHPISDNTVKIYVCGVTVYDLCHLGHARGAIVFDVIRRYLKHKGFNVIYVRNFTDIDDKIINRAKEEDCSTEKIAQRYIEAYKKDFKALGVEPANIEPKATENIMQMIEMVKKLIDKGFAYEKDGDIFFSVRKFPDYGKLSGRDLDQMRAGARVEIDDRKEDPLDFALWKRSKEGEPGWDSPWGRGRPGWHIECSVMSQRYLGDTIDMHGGGEDLIFPHHENEIAQSEAATGKQFVRFWLHNGFVNINKEKMAKSLKNFYTIREILAEYPSEAVRYLLISTHYRSPIDFSKEKITEAKRALERVYTTFRNIDSLECNDKAISVSPQWADKISILNERFGSAMEDDFNTAAALGHIFEFIKEINLSLREKEKDDQRCRDLHSAKDAVKTLGNVLTLFQGENEEKRIDTLAEDLLQMLIDIRQKSRQNKDWAMADFIRDRLSKLGISLEDQPDNKTVWLIER